MTKNEKRIIAIVGSPRRNGNTELIIDSIIEGAKYAGAVSRKVILQDLNIAPCKACNSCTKTGSCVHKDDMNDLLTIMFDSDVWILGTPVYWWGPTAQFKAFLDRWYSVNDRSQFKGKKIILVIPSGGAGEYSYGPTKDMIERVIPYLGMIHVKTILASGIGKKGAVENHPDILDSARLTGRDVGSGHS